MGASTFSGYEETLRQSEARLSAIFMAAEVGLSVISPEGQFLFVNDKLCHVLGRSKEEMLSANIRDITDSEDIQQNMEALQRLIETNRPVSLDKRCIRKDGTIVWVNTTFSLMANDREPAVILVVTTDLTERRQMDEKLRESEERFQLASKIVKIYSWEYDFVTKRLKFSENFEEITGLKPVSDVHKAREYIFPEDRTRMDKVFDKARRTNGDLDFEIRLKKGNSVNWYRISGAILKNRNGRPVRAAGISQNITQRKMLEQQKDDFISIASHELKTPVTSIKAYVEILREIVEAGQGIQDTLLLKKLENQVDRFMKLIRDLLDATRTTEGQLPLYFEKFDLNNLISTCIESIQPGQKKHKLLFNPGKIPLITADKERIEQVLSNLVSNAIKYSPDGGEIVIDSSNIEGAVKVSVHDNGMGIPEELQHKIFTRFFRVQNPQTQMLPGIGLGLYLCSMIIHRHGGTLSVKSKPGEGSVFYFTLPLEHSTNNISL